MSSSRAIVPLSRPVEAVVAVPGSKSHTNRALVCASIATGVSTLNGALVSDDTLAMRDAVVALGARVDVAEGGTRLTVTGTHGRPGRRPARVEARLSGTTSRFALGLAALGNAPIRVDGLEPLRARPMGPSLQALSDLGVTVRDLGEVGHLPVDITGPCVGRAIEVDGSASSQFISGLLLAAPGMRGGLDLTLAGDVVSWPYLELTLDVMADFDVSHERPARNHVVVAEQHYLGGTHAIEPDASTASYFFAAAALTGGTVTVTGLGTDARQGDVAFVDALEAMGATVDRSPDEITVHGPARLAGIEIDMSDISDTAQTLAAIAPFADGPTRITGIGFIRRKETDRIAAVVHELRRCGVDVVEESDGWLITPGKPHGAVIETYDDHRMAMSFALIGLRVPGIEIDDPDCVGKTFPGFWAALDRLR